MRGQGESYHPYMAPPSVYGPPEGPYTAPPLKASLIGLWALGNGIIWPRKMLCFFFGEMDPLEWPPILGPFGRSFGGKGPGVVVLGEGETRIARIKNANVFYRVFFTQAFFIALGKIFSEHLSQIFTRLNHHTSFSKFIWIFLGCPFNQSRYLHLQLFHFASKMLVGVIITFIICIFIIPVYDRSISRHTPTLNIFSDPDCVVSSSCTPTGPLRPSSSPKWVNLILLVGFKMG